MKAKKLFLILIALVSAAAILPPMVFASEEAAVPVEELETVQTVQLLEPVKPEVLDMVFSTVDAPGINEVDKQIILFTVGIKERFALYLERSGKYIDLMKGILNEKGLPEDLAFLPLIESGFSLKAKSRKKAVGPWQFIASTAKIYGLKINRWVDERRDPVKSTIAAADYLGNLYDMFGSWSLAMAAYNAGEGKILRALRKANADDFWGLTVTRHIKPETKNYVPKFIAARLIAGEPSEYGFDDLQYHTPFAYEEAVVGGAVDLKVIAECAGTTVDVINELNPELIRWCTPPGENGYTVRIPEGTKEAFLEKFRSVPKSNRCSVSTYKVKKGDTVKRIAKKTGVDMEIIETLNSIGRKSRLSPGRVLYLPPREG